MNVLGIIPARMESTRFPGKPMKEINGIPMIGHVYYRSKMCDMLSDVYAATCNREIADYISSIGGKAVMTSDKHERASDRSAEAVLKIEAETGKKADIIAMIQGDEPMLLPETLVDLIKPFENDDSLVITNLMADIKTREEHDNPNNVKVVVDKDNYALYFSREPIPSRRKASIETRMLKQTGLIAFKRDFLIKYNSLPPTPLEVIESVDMLRVLEHGYRIKMVHTDNVLQGVDTEADLSKVETIMCEDALVKRYPI